MAPHVFCVLFNTNRQVELHIDAIIMAAMCISVGIELYEIFDGASHFTQFDLTIDQVQKF